MARKGDLEKELLQEPEPVTISYEQAMEFVFDSQDKVEPDNATSPPLDYAEIDTEAEKVKKKLQEVDIPKPRLCYKEMRLSDLPRTVLLKPILPPEHLLKRRGRPPLILKKSITELIRRKSARLEKKMTNRI